MIPSNVDRQSDDGLRHRKGNQTIGVSSGVLVAFDEDRVVFGNEEAGYWAPVEILIERLLFAGNCLRSCMPLDRSSPTRSSRVAGLKWRFYFSAVS